jgi:hypothetical protein
VAVAVSVEPSAKGLSGLIIQKTNCEKKIDVFLTSKIALFNILDYISKYGVSLLYLSRVLQLSEKCAGGYSDESLELGGMMKETFCVSR